MIEAEPLLFQTSNMLGDVVPMERYIPPRHAWITLWNFTGWMDAFRNQMNVMHAVPGTGEFHDAIVAAWPRNRGPSFRAWPDAVFPIMGLGPNEVMVLCIV